MQNFQISHEEKIKHLAFVLLKCPICANDECPFKIFLGKSLMERIEILESLDEKDFLEILKKCYNICGLKSLISYQSVNNGFCN